MDVLISVGSLFVLAYGLYVVTKSAVAASQRWWRVWKYWTSEEAKALRARERQENKRQEMESESLRRFQTEYGFASAILSNPSSRTGISSPIDYQQYLQSEVWRTRSEEAKKRAGYRCQICNRKGSLNTHHRTYARLGSERDEDLIVLCATCHKLFHSAGRLN